MSIRYTVPIADGHAPALTFPARCVSCAQRADTTSRLLIVRNMANSAPPLREGQGRDRRRGQGRGRRRQQTVRIQFDVPHCAACARSTKAVFLAGFIPFSFGFLIAGGIAFVAVGLSAMRAGLDDMGRPENANSLVLGAAAGLMGGIVGGFLFELVARVLLLPIMGKALLRAPLLVPSFFTDSDYIAGLAARPNADSTVTLTFANDDIAREFEAANAGKLTS